MTIKHFIYRIAHESPIGIESLAQRMGVGYQVLNNKLNPNSTSHHLSVAELEMLADFTDGNLALAEYFAYKANAVVMPLPTDTVLGDMGLLDSYMSIDEANSLIAHKFRAAWADGSLTPSEFEGLKQSAHRSIARLLAFIAENERLIK